MITIISGTDRKGSMTRIVSNYVLEKLQSQIDDVQFLSLEDLPEGFFDNKHYDFNNHSSAMNDLQDQYVINADKLIIVSPEYNGSFPGSLKHFLDVLSVRNYKPTFNGKKAALIGVASGRAGNLRGLDHLSAVLMHVGTIVYSNKLPLSSIKNFIKEGILTDEGLKQAIDAQIEGFLNF